MTELPDPLPEQPAPLGICATCGHFAIRHGPDGCTGVPSAAGTDVPCRYGAGDDGPEIPCTMFMWNGNAWPRPWMPAPEGLVADAPMRTGPTS